MVYIMMIYTDEADWVGKSEAEMAPIMTEHDRLEADLRKAGRYRGCGGLAPSAQAKTIRLGGAIFSACRTLSYPQARRCRASPPPSVCRLLRRVRHRPMARAGCTRSSMTDIG